MYFHVILSGDFSVFISLVGLDSSSLLSLHHVTPFTGRYSDRGQDTRTQARTHARTHTHTHVILSGRDIIMILSGSPATVCAEIFFKPKHIVMVP